jgi:single-strand DNA-binding protein
MAEGVNKVLLLGNVGADPELKMTQGGTSVLKIRLATTERYQDKNGVWQDRTDFHSIVVWGKRAESLHKILAKGSQIFVEGGLKTSSYEDRDGNKRYKTEVTANKVILGGRAPGRSRDEEEPRGQRREAPPPSDDDGPPPDLDDSDPLPF